MALSPTSSRSSAAAASGLVLLFDSVLGAPAATIDTGANGIAAGHRDLRILIRAASSGGGGIDTIGISFNSDASANQYGSFTNTQGSTNAAGGGAAAIAILRLSLVPGNTATPASTLGLIDGTVMGYTDAFPKTFAFTFGAMVTAGTNHQSGAGMIHWANTAAITRIALSLGTGPNFITGSRMSVYGTQ